MEELQPKRRKRSMEEPSTNSKTRSFTSVEIAEMTSNFKTVIGKGGFGEVYFGTMNDGTKVAVKVPHCHSISSERRHKTFQAEVKVLTIIYHKNLVSLVGYCDEDGSEALIYHYMANGNLKQNLFEKSERILSWKERLQIALDVAHGLEYLHGCKPPIIHRDLKPENILFNTNMEAKIADFGLSRAFPTESASHISTCFAGTCGYLDLESFNTGHASKKSDVYSFGILLLQLVTGKPAIITSNKGDRINIVHWIGPLTKKGDIWRMVDPRLNGEFNIGAAQKAIKIAVLCVKSIKKRPDISHVVAELKKCSDNPQPQPLATPSSAPLQIGNDTSKVHDYGITLSFSSGDDDEMVESDVELDNTDVVELDNDPPQKMGDPSVEATEEKRDAAQSEMLKAVDGISEGKLDEAIDYLTEAIMLNPISATLYETRANGFVKLKKPNATIRDANAALEINPESAKGFKIRGIANAMLGRWEEATNDLHVASKLDDDEEIGSVLKKVELNAQKIEELCMKYECLWKESEIKMAEKPIQISFSIYDMRQQKSKQICSLIEHDKDTKCISFLGVETR